MCRSGRAMRIPPCEPEECQRELVDQWTNVHGIDQAPDGQDLVNGHPHRVFKDANGTVLVETFTVNGMRHGTPIAPGSGEDQCGIPGPFVLDADICSSFHIARFWGLLDQEPIQPATFGANCSSGSQTYRKTWANSSPWWSNCLSDVGLGHALPEAQHPTAHPRLAPGRIDRVGQADAPLVVAPT